LSNLDVTAYKVRRGLTDIGFALIENILLTETYYTPDSSSESCTRSRLVVVIWLVDDSSNSLTVHSHTKEYRNVVQKAYNKYKENNLRKE
jgi:hypothetical protein